MTKESRIAIVTGASSGIGEAYARKLSSRNYDVTLISRNENKLKGLADELNLFYGVSPVVLSANLATTEGLRRVGDYISQVGKIDGLVNSAGFGIHGYFSSVDLQKSLDMIALHITAPTYLCKLVLPKMENGGFIINISSVASLIPSPGGVVYSATKSYLNEFSKSLQEEVREKGIDVQALCPGFTHTNFHNTQEYNFQKPKIPDWLWMSTEEVVNKSLEALGNKKVIYVPGFKNRLLVKLMNTRLSSLTRKLKKS